MQTTKLIVVRHGNTFNKGDVILRVGARTNLPLTEEGHAQGKRLGAKLEEMKLYPTQFYSAPLRRTVETTLEVKATVGSDAQLQIEDFLTELDYGEDDGRPEKDVVRRLGSLEASKNGIVDASPEQLDELGKKALKRWDEENLLPEGWNFLQERVDKLNDDWRNFGAKIASKHPAETVVATTSNGIARFSMALLPPDTPRPDSLKLSTGAFGVFVLDRGQWKLDAWNVR